MLELEMAVEDLIERRRGRLAKNVQAEEELPQCRPCSHPIR